MLILQNQIKLTLKWAFRDRLFHAVLVTSLFLLLLVFVFSSFSMRQVQELSITLSLSFISFILLLLSTLMGASSVWRDIEKRYSDSALGLPLSRTSYIVAKFFGIALFIMLCAAMLWIVACFVINISSATYPSKTPIHWLTIFTAIAADVLKYILLTAVALLFSSLSTSFFLPYFATISIYLAGSASQEVYEYVSGNFGKTLSLPAMWIIKGVYYLIPNFSAFNLKVQAIYGLPLATSGLALTFLYFLIYTSFLLLISVWIFSRRQLN
jgi:Cu-processing system permease protein